MGDLPNVGFTEADSLALSQNEAVNTWEKAGFSRREALYMVAAVFAGHPGMAPPSE